MDKSAVYFLNALAGWAWYFLVNTYLLIKYGQTVGKYLLTIRIADFETDEVPPFWRLVARIAAPYALSLLGTVGALISLVDTLFIFRKNRRCVHDLIVRTRVVKA